MSLLRTDEAIRRLEEARIAVLDVDANFVGGGIALAGAIGDALNGIDQALTQLRESAAQAEAVRA